MGRTEPYSHQLKKKTERVSGLTNPRLVVVLPVPLAQIKQVHCAKLLGIYLSE